MKTKQKRSGSKKPSKVKADEVEGNENSLVANKQSLELRIKALKKIIKHLSDEEKTR